MGVGIREITKNEEREIQTASFFESWCLYLLNNGSDCV